MFFVFFLSLVSNAPKLEVMRKSIYCLLLALSIPFFSYAQSLNISFNAIQKSITKVESEKLTIEPIFTFDQNTYGKVSLNVSETNVKGSGSNVTYHWNMADIDPNTVVRFVKGKLMAVLIAIRNKQKFIKQVKNDKVSYISDITIPVNNAEHAEVLINEIKASIKLAHLGKLKWTTYSDAMNWIKNNVSEQHVGGKAYKQNLNYYPLQSNKIVFQQLITSSKGSVTENIYEFYINDLFENTVYFDISGDKLEVELKTIGSRKLIKHIKDGSRTNYVSHITILSENIDIARNMILAFQAAISKFEKSKLGFNSVSTALSFVESKVTNIEIGSDIIEQSLVSEKSGLFNSKYTKKTTSSKGVTKEEVYTFFWDHLDGNFINVDVSGNRLYIILKTRGKKKFIGHSINQKTQAFDNELKIEMEDLAVARQLINTLKYSIPLSKAIVPKFTSRIQAINWLKDNIGEISLNDDTFEQLIEVSNSKYVLNVNSSDSKGKSNQLSYEFYPFTLEKNLTQIEIKSKDVLLKLGVTYKNKYVRKIENGIVKSYSDEVSIKCQNVMEAQIMKAAINYIIENTPKLGKFGSASQAKAYFLNNIGRVEIPGITFDQSISIKDSDKCVVLYNYDKVSSKGKAESRLYEFNLGYLYPEQLKLKVKGKELFIELITRGKQKLIKYYKNNELQNYTNTLSLQINDVMAGLRLEIALKMLADDCEK